VRFGWVGWATAAVGWGWEENLPQLDLWGVVYVRAGVIGFPPQWLCRWLGWDIRASHRSYGSSHKKREESHKDAQMDHCLLDFMDKLL